MRQYVITIPSPAAAISLLPAGIKDIQIAGITLQPRAANGNQMFIGDASVSGTNYAFALAAGAGGVAPAPIVIQPGDIGLMQLSQLFVFGTAGQILHVGVFLR